MRQELFNRAERRAHESPRTISRRLRRSGRCAETRPCVMLQCKSVTVWNYFPDDPDLSRNPLLHHDDSSDSQPILQSPGLFFAHLLLLYFGSIVFERSPSFCVEKASKNVTMELNDDRVEASSQKMKRALISLPPTRHRQVSYACKAQPELQES